MNATPGPDLLDRVIAPNARPFALLHRPTVHPGQVQVLTGDVTNADRIADIPGPRRESGPADVLALVPYRQLRERGFPAPDDGCPLIAIIVREQSTIGVGEFLSRVPDVEIKLANERFDIDDAAYARLVERVLTEEIGAGEGANFVLKRSYLADVSGYSRASALALFRRLISHEPNAYWTFLVDTGDRTLVGASPERHLSVADGIATMNPISGTYRYPPTGPNLAGVLKFLDDAKEINELYMVLDEELKMMAGLCDGAVRVTGPLLKEMARLAHTEYFIEGRTRRGVRDLLAGTLFAPTVTGSPLENASRVIAKYEPGGRGYYSGVAALIGHDERGGATLDSAILIRTADIDARGRLAITVGATLVRDSQPESEVAETHAKANGLLSALRAHPSGSLAAHAAVRSALNTRGADVARFWRSGPDGGDVRPNLPGKRVLVVDAEDSFTAMIASQLRSSGLSVTVRRFDDHAELDEHDLVVLGPGPGDPLAFRASARIAALHEFVRRLLAERRPFLAVCLSHQVLCHQLGLQVVRRTVPNQGVRQEIDLFGRRERVGFYNSFVATSPASELGAVEIARDPGTGEVHTVRGPHFAGVQFHAESVLTLDGEHNLGRLISGILASSQDVLAH